ncbi:MAG: hypothetical protein ACKVOH_01370 [Chlamydiales bacterium]
MKVFLLFILLFSVGFAQSRFVKTNDPNNPTVEHVHCVTMPKGGTHLLISLMERIAKELGVDVSSTHKNALYTNTHTMNISKNPQNFTAPRKIILIRDPRDATVSAIDRMNKVVESGEMDNTWYLRNWPRLTYQQKIYTFLYEPHARGLHAFEWMTIEKVYFGNPEYLMVRFEDLVGAKGGGSDERQLFAIQSVLDYMRINFSNETVKKIASEIWGPHYYTFNKGVIGRYKIMLTEPAVKQMINDRLGEMIIRFGYAKDLNW